jgi:hypothetical protein
MICSFGLEVTHDNHLGNLGKPVRNRRTSSATAHFPKEVL